MRLQIAHQRNLLLQLIETLTIHGLLASIDRIRQTALRSQATMVGARRRCKPTTPAFAQQHTLSSRRWAHRWIVDGSGERDGSLQCGAACSTETPAAIDSQACCRQRKLKCPEGSSQLGQDRKRLSAWMTDSAPHQQAFMLVVVGLAESPSMADDRVVPADRALPRQQAQWDHPGSTLSFASGSAIKRITAGVKARR
jgi:hypothetical protein